MNGLSRKQWSVERKLRIEEHIADDECICREANSQDMPRRNEDGSMTWIRNGEILFICSAKSHR